MDDLYKIYCFLPEGVLDGVRPSGRLRNVLRSKNGMVNTT